MTNGKTDTQELMTVIEQPTPDVTEGEAMPITLEMLDMRIKVIEVEINALKEWRTTLLSPQQITDMIKTAIDGSVGKVENLVNTIADMVSENDAKLTTRAQNAAASDRKLDAVVQFINTLAADDVTNPDSKPSGLSWFQRVEQMATAADNRAHSAALEISQARLDHVEAMRKAEEQAAALEKQNEQIAPLVELSVKTQSLINLATRVMRSRPTMALLVAAFGGGAVLTPEIVKLIGNLIVSVFTGAN